MDQEHRPLRGLANALILLLSLQLTMLAGRLGLGISIIPRFVSDWLAGAEAGLIALTVIVFLKWFRRARINAEASGWHQRHGPGWTFWGWLVPLVHLWIPFQMMADIWRASLPEDRRRDTAWLPWLWWLCWLAGIATMARVRAPRPRFSVFLAPPTQWWSTAALAAAAALLIVIVGRVSDSPIG